MKYILKPDFTIAKLFSDKTRQRIIELLSEREMTNAQLASQMQLSKPTLSHHLKLLSDNKIIKVSRIEHEVHGIPMKYYSLNPEMITISDDRQINEDVKKELFKSLFGGQTREELGDKVSLVFLRLLKSSIIESGIELDRPMYHAGYNLGKNVFSKQIKTSEFDSVIKEIADIWSELKLGKVEQIGKDRIRVRDCYQCHKMPDVGKPLCPSDEGIIAGILDTVLGKSHYVREVKCWGTGYDYCEFEIRVDSHAYDR
ncbi:putative hydrocarbon binding protein (contains V4R domain) [Candidatus Methanoperedens nitroreducens]|uniref:Putative hydrocarbon binding protein (Contains V4R domain) n=1 Tax=Candidatus Methanoperedens nitratireducens TaxID=1392998 RepID=A0A062V0H2_9EURY|nr:V4R domain-containing protein [Candidatus Methanoperedens nitroreducens]KCZ70872.1 putative hydrocarbon binding protein (contains V4R domain) [Candidatus Methanoperedens nitroreducens]MDJ1420727.1 ArsR family transcriptional regulator [Candidatus Methanoperedens sp.]